MGTLVYEGIGLVCRQLGVAVTYQTQWSKSQRFPRVIAQPAWIEGRKKNNMARSGFCSLEGWRVADWGWIDDGSLSQEAPVMKGVEKCESSHPKVTQTKLCNQQGMVYSFKSPILAKFCSQKKKRKGNCKIICQQNIITQINYTEVTFKLSRFLLVSVLNLHVQLEHELNLHGELFCPPTKLSIPIGMTRLHL